MSTIVTRAGKGSPLTWDEADSNFTNLNNDKIETSSIGSSVQAYDSNLTSFLGTFNLPTVDGSNGQILSTNGSGTLSFSSAGAGSVTSVGITVPTGLTVTGSPITSSGTFAISLTSGYVIPTTTSTGEWDSAYSQRLQWDGGSTNLVAATARTSLGATTLGENIFTIINPSAETFPRFNADNTISSLSASAFRSAIGAGSGDGTVTNVSALTIGTTGTDLSSSVSNGTTTPVITLNVPTASSSNRGALSSTDWSTFNNKQAALVSGTNIKTVNGTTLLGSGDVGTIDIAHGGTNNASLAVTAGGVIYTDGTKLVNVGAGTSGQVLQSNGASAPTWATATATASGGLINTQYFTTATQTVTMTIASPCVVTYTSASSLPKNGSQIVFTTTGALPTGLTANTVYYVINASGTTSNVSATKGGSAINTSGSQSGTHTAQSGNYTATSGTNSVIVELVGGGGNGVNTGGTTSFGAFCSGTGGTVAGGAGTGGDFNLVGGRGSTSGTGSGFNLQGGTSIFGGAGAGTTTGAAAGTGGGGGLASSGTGARNAGGAGGYSKLKITSSFSGTAVTVGVGATGGASSGGDGGSGIVIVYEYS